MVDTLLPNKLLNGSATLGGNDQNWTYQPSSDPGFNKPFRFTYSLSITPQTVSSPNVKGLDGTMKYTALDINIGDWVASTSQARALRIVDITAVSEIAINVTLEDTGRYNTVQDTGKSSNASISSGACVVFSVDSNGDALMHSLANTSIGSVPIWWSSELISRFQSFKENLGLYYYYPAHNLTRGTYLRVAATADVVSTVLTGTNTSPTVTAGDKGRINTTNITWPALTGATNIANYLNSLNLDSGKVVASVNTGAIVLTATDGRNIYIQDIVGSTSLGTGLGLISKSGVYVGKLIPVTSNAQTPVAVVKNTGASPDYFYYDWMGKALDIVTTIPGNVGDLVYVDNSGNYTLTPPNVIHQVMVKLQVPTPNIILGKNAGSIVTNTSFVINKVICTPAGTGVTDVVLAINNLAIPNVTAASVGGALQVTNSSGDKIVIMDGFQGSVTTNNTLGLRNWNSNGSLAHKVLVLETVSQRLDNPHETVITPTTNQTAFTLPVGTVDVVALIINGIGSTDYTVASGILTFNASAAGFTLDSGDQVLIQYNVL